MKQIEITINGTSWPCRQTMGAMLRFKRETGREATEIDPSSLSDLCTFLWCCVVSASKADGKDFGMSLMEFADAISPDTATAWAEAARAGSGDPQPDSGEGEKKS